MIASDQCGISPLLGPKILILSSEFPPGPGGIGTHAHQLARQLHLRGWEVEVASPQELANADAIERFNRHQPFAVHQLRQLPSAPAKLAYRIAVITRLLRNRRPDVIVASGERMVWVAAMLSPLFGIPYVAVGHAMEFNPPAPWRRILNRRTFAGAASVICVSKYTHARMVELGVNAKRSEVIPNGADEARFHTLPENDTRAFRAAHGFGDAPLLVTVGSVHERKGQDVVIRALPRVLASVPDAHYVMVGHPYRRDSFAALARSLGVEAHAHFLGAVSADEMVRALNAADLFVMASQHTANGDFEGYGIAVVEAALCGLPAVVSDNSGVMEAIEPDETGIVVQISNPEATAKAIVTLLSDPVRRCAMGRRARERALQEKTWSVRGAEYDRHLRDLVAEPSS